MTTEAQKRARDKYNKKAYDLIVVHAKKELAAEVRRIAAEQGKSLNGFINEALIAAIKKEQA